MNKVKLFLLGLLAAMMLPVAAQQGQLPLDPAVRYGKLPNGLTYYIRKNAKPEGQVNFYIAQKVGSVQEEDSQRGLAHFLEHMAFNGSKHFPNDGQLIKYCESIGVKFGQNLNAYTSTDETVYNIDNVPVSPSNIDSCLYILADWSGGLLLSTKEIDKERGVIHEEWRMRTTGMMRIYERQLPNLYPGSRYGNRMPIGTMDVVLNFPPDTLRAYYHKWYRPDLQGVVVVGDIDVDQMESKIKSILGAIEMPANAAKYEHYPVPANNEPIYIIDKDKEVTNSSIYVMFKHDPLPEELRGTMTFLLKNYFDNVITSSIDARLAELAKKADSPFTAAGVGYGNYLVSKTADAFQVYVAPKPGMGKEAVQAVMQEVERAMRFGLTEGEVIRQREEFLASLESAYNNREKQNHNYYTSQYVRHFLEGNATPGIEVTYPTFKQLAPALPAEVFNELLKGYAASTDTNFVLMAVYPDKEGVAVPTVDELKSAIAAAKAANLEAYVDNVKSEPLIPVLPKKGKIKKTKAAPFGYTEWTLSNGARVYFKQTDFNDDQVSFGARSFGGSYKFNDSQVVNAKLLDAAIASAGLGDFTATDLQKKLAGKKANVASSLNRLSEELNGGSTPKDLRTLFELIYLKFQKPGHDVEAFNSLITMLRTQLQNAEKDPQKAFRDSINSTLYNNHPRYLPVSLADLDKVNFDEIQRMYTERFKSAGDFDFYFTGAFNVDSLRIFTEQYIASLPGVKKRETYTDLNLNPVQGVVENRFYREMETPQAMLLQYWNGLTPYDMKTALVASVFGDVLDKRYLKSIREDGGMAYSVNAAANVQYGSRDRYSLQIVCPFTPEKVDSVLYLMDLGIQEIARDGVRADELDEIKKFEEKQYTAAQRTNDYWEGLIVAKNMWGKDQQTGYLETLRSVTSDDVKRFVNEVLLRDRNRATVIMLPSTLLKK
ncbi:MAG: insulinase family protein [Bacteroidaceae bacterium]|nr:insulinase family protein [Bacteroidaceae bacterium]